MKIDTARFGEIDVHEERLMTFANGIPGLEHFKTYFLLPADDKDESPFYFLQSTEESGLCFFLADPFSFYPNYEVNLDNGTLDQLELNEPKNALVLSILTVQGSLQDATMNLKAPLIFNTVARSGKQMVLKQEYGIKEPLLKQVAAQEGE
ncbi:flagellar assembly protein FliW [Alkalihalobacillus macyae]|uniref:flagellar assembly protein FliW n=1 Tax=Guptibacillus hwajinpoensis TaxID=208199 RepID=UPI00273C2844|nr:flagellar assembly protein FliW [Alkalihalobacillus macyae]MDP4551443.1 flagellar assembly protein FliW [Alkalihalobacillus macyae]